MNEQRRRMKREEHKRAIQEILQEKQRRRCLITLFKNVKNIFGKLKEEDLTKNLPNYNISAPCDYLGELFRYLKCNS